jgi:hypothetical protein
MFGMVHEFIDIPPDDPIPYLTRPAGFVNGNYGKAIWGDNPKKPYVWLGEKLGYNFASAWNKLMFREWVAPHHSLIYPLCFGPFGRHGRRLDYSYVLLSLWWRRKGVILTAEKDGIFNISPLMMYSELPEPTPKELKNYYGNGLWKKLANQSLNRNKLISRLGWSPAEISRIIDLPTAGLKVLRQSIPLSDVALREIMLMKKERRLYALSEPGWFVRMEYDISDTRRMAAQLNQPFSENWNYARVYTEHQRLSEMYQQQRGRYWVAPKAAPIENPFKTVCGPGTVIGEKYDLILLDSEEKIREEGTEMKHCVSSYATDAARGTCSIYSIRDKTGKRKTTLQVHPGDVAGQHYGKCNTAPPEDINFFVRTVLQQPPRVVA